MKANISMLMATAFISIVASSIIRFHQEHVFADAHHPCQMLLVFDKKDHHQQLKKIKVLESSSPLFTSENETNYSHLVNGFVRILKEKISVSDFSDPDMMSGFTLRPPPEA